MLQFGLRLGEHPRQVVTTTPRPIPLIRDFLAREGQGVTVTRGSTYDNRANLAPGFFKSVVKRYEGWARPAGAQRGDFGRYSGRALDAGDARWRARRRRRCRKCSAL